MHRKAPKPTKEVSSYEIRDIVLGKVRGFPPWPGMVVDPDSVPQGVSRERPTGSKTVFYCVQFFPTGDYAWLVAKDISKLKTHEIESYINEPYKKSGELLSGYRIALDPKKWLEDRENATNEIVEEEANAEVDQLDSENEDGEPKKAKTKKRKRESDAAPAAPKAKRAPKAKKGSAEPVKKKATLAAGRGKKNGTKSKAMVESEDEADQAEAEAEDEDAGPSKKASPPPAKKAKRDKEEEGDDAKFQEDPEALRVREWRHKLQKTFLSNKGLPKEDEMPALDELFTTVENYEKMDITYLSFSKIGKVMRHIAVLAADKVPRDAEYKFRDRAKSLVDKWHQILNANKPLAPESASAAVVVVGGGPAGVAAAMNGAQNGEGEKEDKADKEAGDVTEGTAALDLNGKTDVVEDSTLPPAESGDLSVLADVTMSEA